MPEQRIVLREATIDDLELLRYWDTKPHVIASDPDDDWEWEENLNAPQPFWREQFVAELDGEPIGFLQIIDPHYEESHYWGDVEKNLRAIDIWIGEEHHLGKGYGTEMMQSAFRHCFSDSNVTSILIDPLVSNTRAIRFYKRLGFEFVQNRWFEGSHCAVHRLEKKRWKTISAQSI
ncbi:MAG: GNAT family N-acetyltransferase [Bacteroidota bacterium]